MSSASRMAAGALLIIVSGLGTAVPAGAWEDAADASAAEYAKVPNRASQQAHQVFGITGRVPHQNGTAVGNGAREYPMCAVWTNTTHKRRVQVQYNNFATRGGPM